MSGLLEAAMADVHTHVMHAREHVARGAGSIAAHEATFADASAHLVQAEESLRTVRRLAPAGAGAALDDVGIGVQLALEHSRWGGRLGGMPKTGLAPFEGAMAGTGQALAGLFEASPATQDGIPRTGTVGRHVSHAGHTRVATAREIILTSALRSEDGLVRLGRVNPEAARLSVAGFAGSPRVRSALETIATAAVDSTHIDHPEGVWRLARGVEDVRASLNLIDNTAGWADDALRALGGVVYGASLVGPG